MTTPSVTLNIRAVPAAAARRIKAAAALRGVTLAKYLAWLQDQAEKKAGP